MRQKKTAYEWGLNKRQTKISLFNFIIKKFESQGERNE